MTELQYSRRRILIWGKTRPELSRSYREVVCTGGVFEDTKRLVRLYPIPLRFLPDQHMFRKYQWIEADIARNTTDTRPESYKIRFEGIKLGETIPTKNGNWDARAEWVLQPENLYKSVEALVAQQRVDGTSLGLIQPAKVSNITFRAIPDREKTEFEERYREAVMQMELPLDPDTGREIKPLKAADYRFKIHFRCNDHQCQQDHQFSVLDWEVDALYFRLRSEYNRSPELAAQGVVEKLHEYCDRQKETRFFLGNIAAHPQTFTIVGLWYPRVQPQLALF